MDKITTVPGREMFGPNGNISSADAKAFASRLPAFTKWATKVAGNFKELTEVKILDVYPFGPAATAQRGFVMADVKAMKGGKPVSGFAFIRGGAVCVLVILQDETGQEYVVTVMQPRVPGGELNYEEIPAGMLDTSTSEFASVAIKELKEELGLAIKESDLVKLSDMYPSIGGCDEMITVFVYRGKMSKAAIDEFKGKHTGEPSENEQIITKLRTYDDFKVACRSSEITDVKAQVAIGLYEMLKAEKGADAVPIVSSMAGGRRRKVKKVTRKRSSHSGKAKKSTRKH